MTLNNMETVPEQPDNGGDAKHSAALDSLVEEWTLLRLRSPVALPAQLNEASKQLITVGGVLQGIYVAVYAFGGLTKAPAWVGVIIFVPLVAMIFFAARCVCVVPPGAEAMGAFRVLRREALEGRDLGKLENDLDSWCKSVDAVAADKKRYLHLANWSFVFATLAALGSLVFMMATGGTS